MIKFLLALLACAALASSEPNGYIKIDKDAHIGYVIDTTWIAINKMVIRKIAADTVTIKVDKWFYWNN
jgi:hypothetical protein